MRAAVRRLGVFRPASSRPIVSRWTPASSAQDAWDNPANSLMRRSVVFGGDAVGCGGDDGRCVMDPAEVSRGQDPRNPTFAERVAPLTTGVPRVSLRARSEVSDAERHAWKTQLAWLAIAAVLDREPTFWSQVDAIRAAADLDQKAWEAAKRYGTGRRREIIASFLASVAEPDNRAVARRLLYAGLPHAPDRTRETRRVHGPRPDGVAVIEAGARFVARRGLGQCLADGCEAPARGWYIKSPLSNRKVRLDYCGDHQTDAQSAWRERLIDRFFDQLA